MTDTNNAKQTLSSKLRLIMARHGKWCLHLLTISSPNVASVARKALDVNNHVAQQTYELDTALSMTELAGDPSVPEGEAKWKIWRSSA